MLGTMQWFQGDFSGKRCVYGKRSSDVYNDYLDILDGVVCDSPQIKWKLVHMATYDEYESWERHMQDGFYRCNTYGYLDNPTCVLLALRRVDKEIARWWDKEMCDKDIIDTTWKDFNNFLRGCFISPCRKVSCTKSVKAVPQSSRAGVLLQSPTGEKLHYVPQIHFEATNNMAEYEALIHGLRIAKNIGIKRIVSCGDSDLVAQQVAGTWNARNPMMAAY